MIEALWVQQWHNVVDQALLKRMLRSSEPWARAAATRVLCYWRDRVPDALALLKTQAADAHPAVRLEAVRAASFFQTPDAVALAQEVAEGSAGQVPGLRLQQSLTTLNVLGKEARRRRLPAEARTRRPRRCRICQPPRCAATCATRACRTSSIGTVPEQMLFDVRWFVVEAGKPVQLTLTNSDFMPHNLIVGQPGSVYPIGTAAATMPAAGAPERARLRSRPSACCRPRASCSATSRTRSNSPRRRSRATTTSSARSPATGSGCMA